eukprot:jgi/Ulvmu1/6555/UM003_0190.1
MQEQPHWSGSEPAAVADMHDDHGGEEGDEHAGHDHRRRSLLGDGHDEHDHAEHADHGDEEAVSAQRVLTVGSLEAMHNATEASELIRGEQAVQDALMYITACIIDPACVLDGAPDIDTDGHGDHGDADDHSGSSYDHLALKLGLAAAFFAMTVAASYLPLIFMWSSNYQGILTLLNVFSGSMFLSVGVLHLLPHVAEYEEAADLSTDFPVGLSFVMVGFVLILYVERVLFDVDCSAASALTRRAESDTSDDSSKYSIMSRASSIVARYHSPLLTEAAVVLHAVLESMVLGLSTNKEDVWLLFVSITSHKVFTTMSQSARFLRLGCPPGLLFLLLLPFHILPPLGVVLGAVTGNEDPLAALILAGLSTGTFFYVGGYEIIAEEFSNAHAHPTPRGPNGGPDCCDGDGSGCIGLPLPPGKPVDSDGDDGGDANDWSPSKLLKFAVFVLGIGTLMAVTAALPSHAHDH